MKWWGYLIFLLALFGAMTLNPHLKKYEFVNNKYLKIVICVIGLVVFLSFIKTIF